MERLGEGTEGGGSSGDGGFVACVTGAADEFASRLAAIEAELAALADVQVHLLADGDCLELTAATARVSGKLDAQRSRVVDQVDRRRLHKLEGAVTTGSWLGHRANMGSGTASKEVKRARGLRELPLVAAAFRAGEISADQVDHFVRVGSAPWSGGDSRVILGVGQSPVSSSAVTVGASSRSG